MRTLISRTKSLSHRGLKMIDTRPLTAFFGFLVLLLVIIIVGNFLRTPKTAEEQQESEPRLVQTYVSGQSPTVSLTGRVEKSGVITVVAQTGGVVQAIQVTEGGRVGRGTTLVGLSATYSGGNPASLSRQMAQKNAEFTNETFQLQKDIVSHQRDLAIKGETQGDDLREISKKSIDETKSLISLNEEIISALDSQITSLTASNVGSVNDAAILGAKQGKAGAVAGVNQLKSALRATEYQTSDDKIPAQLGQVNRDMALKQLDLQEKSLTLAKEISDLNLKLARVSESLYYPSSPCVGVVERVFVKPGQSINPGMPIAVIKADKQETSIVVPVSIEIARQVSKTEASVITIQDKKIKLYPQYISTEATDGGLATITYSLPAESSSSFANASNVTVEVPLGVAQIAVDQLYIPLDAVYQTQEEAFIYSLDGETAKVKEVTLGDVSGRYVKVVSGLTSTDHVIITRGVTDGDRVRTE